MLLVTFNDSEKRFNQRCDIFDGYVIHDEAIVLGFTWRRSCM